MFAKLHGRPGVDAICRRRGRKRKLDDEIEAQGDRHLPGRSNDLGGAMMGVVDGPGAEVFVRVGGMNIDNVTGTANHFPGQCESNPLGDRPATTSGDDGSDS